MFGFCFLENDASNLVQRGFSAEEQKPRVYHEPSFLSRASPFLPPEGFLSQALEFQDESITSLRVSQSPLHFRKAFEGALFEL